MVKYLIKISFLFVFLIVLSSSKSGKTYLQYESDKGTVFYFFEQKMDAVEKNKNVKQLKYDYTFVEEPDSVTVLSTLNLNGVYKPKSATLSYNNKVYTADCDIIFIKTGGKLTEYRLRFTIPFEVWEELYRSINPVTFSYAFDNNGNSINFDFADSPKKWAKQREKMCNLIEMIKLNTGKL